MCGPVIRLCQAYCYSRLSKTDLFDESKAYSQSQKIPEIKDIEQPVLFKIGRLLAARENFVLVKTLIDALNRGSGEKS
jgi:hypothetical protein